MSDWVMVPREPTGAMLDAAEPIVNLGPMDVIHVDDRVWINGTWTTQPHDLSVLHCRSQHARRK